MIVDEKRRSLNKIFNGQDEELPRDADLEQQSVVDWMRDGVGNEAQARTAHCAAITGSMLGAIGGCLAGIGILAVPGVGVLLAIGLGTSGTAVASTLIGAGTGLAAGSLISAFAASAVPED